MEKNFLYLYQVKEFSKKFMNRWHRVKFKWLPLDDCFFKANYDKSEYSVVHPAYNKYMVNFPKEYFKIVPLEELLTLEKVKENPYSPIDIYNYFAKKRIIELGWAVSLNITSKTTREKNNILKIHSEEYKIKYLLKGKKNSYFAIEENFIYNNIRIPTEKEIKAAEKAWEKGIYPIKTTDIEMWLSEKQLNEKDNFDNCKIKINSPEESKLVQEKLFQLGYKWYSEDKEVQHIYKKYLYTDLDKRITHNNDDNYFKNDSRKEINIEDLEIKDEKLKKHSSVSKKISPIIEKQIKIVEPHTIKNKLEIPIKKKSKEKINIVLYKKNNKLQF